MLFGCVGVAKYPPLLNSDGADDEGGSDDGIAGDDDSNGEDDSGEDDNVPPFSADSDDDDGMNEGDWYVIVDGADVDSAGNVDR